MLKMVLWVIHVLVDFTMAPGTMRTCGSWSVQIPARCVESSLEQHSYHCIGILLAFMSTVKLLLSR